MSKPALFWLTISYVFVAACMMQVVDNFDMRTRKMHTPYYVALAFGVAWPLSLPIFALVEANLATRGL